MAKRIDPDGGRTLGVLTKIDIMDRGTNAKNVLLGKDVPLTLGYVGVKLRSQQDIIDGKTVQVALKDEKNFFSTNPIYSMISAGYLGVESLTHKLTKLLYGHIKKFLPDIVKEIRDKIKQNDQRIKELGPGLPKNDSERYLF